MRIAVEGCAHGQLEDIYDTISYIEKRENYKVDLLLCCGDFQSTRNASDLHCMAIPKRYHDICTFYKYYSGEKVAPILTIFIGGNHEASNYLQELPYGGWVAKNIYYLGYAGVVNINGIRIAGISGIYKGHDYLKGRFEYPPYSEDTKRSVYHIRQMEIYRLKQLSPTVDIVLSHDWPRGVYNHGNHQQLVKFKPHFKEEIESDNLGNPVLSDLMKQLKPKYWFAAHLHCKFSAAIKHEDGKVTKFLALDKCLPKRRFLQILDVDVGGDSDDRLKLSYDLEWLSILVSTKHLLSVKNSTHFMPSDGSTYRYDFNPTGEEKDLILKVFDNNLEIPQNFIQTAPAYDPSVDNSQFNRQPKPILNPQTLTLCNQLQIDDPLQIAMVMNGHDLSENSFTDNHSTTTTSDESFTSMEISPLKRMSIIGLPSPKQPSEQISLSDCEDGSLSINDSLCSVSPLSTTDSSSFLFDVQPSLKSSANESISLEGNLADVSESISEDSTRETVTPVRKPFIRRNRSIYESIDD